MHARKFLFRLGMVVAPLVVTLAMGGPVTQAATLILIDDGTTADGCGNYNGDTAVTNPVTAIGNAPSNSTIVICPGTYALSGIIAITNKSKLTIKAALPIAGSRPVLQSAAAEDRIIEITSSTGVTLDGLILDGRTTNETLYRAMMIWTSPVTIKNSVIISPDGDDSYGIVATGGNATKPYTLTISSTYFAGYSQAGISAQGSVKLNVTSCHLDASDGGRVTSGIPRGIDIQASSAQGMGTGTVTKTRILNSDFGITIRGGKKLNITNNTLINNNTGIRISAVAADPGLDGLKISGNQILSIPGAGRGISVSNPDAFNVPMKKITISKNVIAASENGATGNGVYAETNVAAQSMVTGTITGNTLIGFTTAFSMGATGITVGGGNFILP